VLYYEKNLSTVAESRYYPYGEERWSSDTLPTDYRFTGQRLDGDLGLYQMGARFYDPYLKVGLNNGKAFSQEPAITDLENVEFLGDKATRP
jgi:RHS repeat-associated protein